MSSFLKCCKEGGVLYVDPIDGARCLAKPYMLAVFGDQKEFNDLNGSFNASGSRKVSSCMKDCFCSWKALAGIIPPKCIRKNLADIYRSVDNEEYALSCSRHPVHPAFNMSFHWRMTPRE